MARTKLSVMMGWVLHPIVTATTTATKKFSCVNAIGIPPATQQVLVLLFSHGGEYSSPCQGVVPQTWPGVPQSCPGWRIPQSWPGWYPGSLSWGVPQSCPGPWSTQVLSWPDSKGNIPHTTVREGVITPYSLTIRTQIKSRFICPGLQGVPLSWGTTLARTGVPLARVYPPKGPGTRDLRKNLGLVYPFGVDR